MAEIDALGALMDQNALLVAQIGLLRSTVVETKADVAALCELAEVLMRSVDTQHGHVDRLIVIVEDLSRRVCGDQ